MKRVFFKTFGCRTNIFDTEVMIKNLGNSEFMHVENPEIADFIVVNSCTVTNSADSNVRQFVNRAKRDFPNAKIIFTGCGIAGEGLKLFDSGIVKMAFGHSEKENIKTILLNNERKYIINDLNHLDKTIVDNFSSRSRAFIKIQEGCNFKCSYCIIPSVRGNARSYKKEHILEQVRKLAGNGFGEIVLTGTNIGSYGDSRNSLAMLIREISQIRGVRRIRLGSVEPSQITADFIEMLDEKFLGKYLHVAIQYSNDQMLKIMNRRNRVDSDLKLFDKLYSHGFAIGTDFIVGHVGETDEIFNDALKKLNDYPLTHIHLFKYSRRDGTASANMNLKEIHPDLVRERFDLIDDLINKKSEKFRDEVMNNKTVLNVLFEKEIEKIDEFAIYEGYDQYFFPVKIKSKESLEGYWAEINDYNWRENN